MAVQAYPPEAARPRRAPAAPGAGNSPPSLAISPPNPEGASPLGTAAVVELVGRRVAPPMFGATGNGVHEAVLSHQLHEIDQVLEIAHLSELLVEKDARIALLERGIADWRERAQVEIAARMAAARLAHDRERELVAVIHHQINGLEQAEVTSQAALARNDELQARLDDQFAAIESSEQTSQAAVARMHELQLRIDDLEDLLRRPRRWWRRRAA